MEPLYHGIWSHLSKELSIFIYRKAARSIISEEALFSFYTYILLNILKFDFEPCDYIANSKNNSLKI